MPGDPLLLPLCLALPLSYLAAAAVIRFAPPRVIGTGAGLAQLASGAALTVSVALAALTALGGARTLAIIDFGAASPAFRLDAISLSILVLVTAVGFVVIRFSRNYLDGDPRQTVFFSRLAATLATTVILALAGDLIVFALGWIALSLVLHGLLVFYPERPLAILAARKKFIAARLGDLCILSGFALLWTGAGTTDITAISAAAATGALSGLGLPAALLIAVAALMKSAQWPFHGWITEVMETPTPVSALLHAGIVNAGGFAVLRFSGLIAENQPALWLLAMVGGGTALFASVVMLTQPRIKTQLAWSTIAQMGFMMLQCGFGAFSSALLHILAHSLYKAHAFLWAGSAVDGARTARLPLASLSPARAAASFALALGMFGVAVLPFLGQLWDKPAIIVLGSIVVLGMGQAIAASLAAGGGAVLLARVSAMMFGLALVYFTLQLGMAWLLDGAVHAAPPASPIMVAIMGLTFVSFLLLSFAQAMGLERLSPGWARTLRVHAANGFYVNALFNRIAGALQINTARS